MCGACACRGRYLQQLPSSLAASARHRKDILARCRGRLQQLPRMYTGRTSRPRRRTRSSCAVVPSRHNQRCAKPHAVRIPWRTRGAACALWQCSTQAAEIKHGRGVITARRHSNLNIIHAWRSSSASPRQPSKYTEAGKYAGVNTACGEIYTINNTLSPVENFHVAAARPLYSTHAHTARREGIWRRLHVLEVARACGAMPRVCARPQQ